MIAIVAYEAVQGFGFRILGFEFKDQMPI